MASVVFNVFKAGSAKADIDLDSATLWAALVMTNTTVDSEDSGIDAVGDFATLDECDGANYVRKPLQNVSVTRNDGNLRIDVDADDITWTALGNGTRDIQGVLIYIDADNDGDSADDAANTPVCFLDYAVDQSPGGSDFKCVMPASRFLSLS